MKYPTTILRHIPLSFQKKMLIRIIDENLDYFLTLFNITDLKKNKQKPYKDSELIFEYFFSKTSGRLTIDRYSQLFREQLCSQESILNNVITSLNTQFVDLIDYHFNYRTLDLLALEVNRENESQLSALLHQHVIENYRELIDCSLTYIESKEQIFTSFILDEGKIIILERIGYYRLENEIFSSFMVKYTIDLKSGFLEYHWNKTAAQKFYKNMIPQQNVIKKEDDLLRYMKNRIITWFSGAVQTQSLETNAAPPELGDHHSIESAFNNFPFEACLYKLFMDDHDILMNTIIQNNNLDIELLSGDSELSNHLETKYDFDSQNSSKAHSLINAIYFRALANEIDFLELNQYIYSFTLRDIVNVTSSKTRHNRREPVYHTEPYWYLLDMIKRLKVITEISFHYELYDVQTHIRYQQKFTLKLRKNKLTFEFLQSNSEDESNLFYISKSRRRIYEHFKRRISNFIYELSETKS